MPLLFVEVRGAKAYGGVGLRTHPLDPSQREGENLLVKDYPLNSRQMNH